MVALLLVHGVSHQTIQGAKSTDPGDPEAPTEPSSVKVECASAAGGPRLNGDGNRVDIGDLENARDVHEDDGYTLDQEGISIDDVSDVCGRKRTERLTHAVELGVLGLVLGGSAVLLVRDGRGTLRGRGARSPTVARGAWPGRALSRERLTAAGRPSRAARRRARGRPAHAASLRRWT